jgi:hypothetical protein
MKATPLKKITLRPIHALEGTMITGKILYIDIQSIRSMNMILRLPVKIDADQPRFY